MVALKIVSCIVFQGHSTKGMSCTDKNTMVFVVLEGEITVILHTTQFNAKKGDSFYIPPKVTMGSKLDFRQILLYLMKNYQTKLN